MPVMLIFVILVCVLLQYKIRHNTKDEVDRNAEFWERERRANTARKKNIDELPYITVPECLPYHEDESDPEVRSVEEQVRKLSGVKMLRLTGLSNTDLKLAYGVANLNTLSACDENYARFIRCLNKWGRLLAARGEIENARKVLSLAVSVGSDIEESYVLLAGMYEGDDEKIEGLLAAADKNFEEPRRSKVMDGVRHPLAR